MTEPVARDPTATLAPSAIGFGVVPGTPEEARAHVQARVRAYVGLFAALWTAMFFIQLLLRSLVGARVLLNAVSPVVAFLHLGEAALLVVTWALLRGRKFDLRALDAIDAGATKTQAVVLAAMLYFGGQQTHRTELVILLAVTNLLAGRAALVPCTAGRTLILGAVAVSPLPVVSYVLYSRAGTPADFTPFATSALVTIWASLAVLLSTAITRIIYGLERKVKEASQLGQYTLESQVGAGGMGTVYLARHALLRRPTAIKLLPPDKAGKDAIKRFEREVQLTSQLTHPNIVAIYDYGQTPDGVFYYAMEFLSGIDLERLVVDTKRLPPARVRHIVRQVADALAEAHAIHLIHRDVKPANVILVNRGRQYDVVKVLDFGLVKDVRSDGGSATKSSIATLIGTPLYISPESITDPSKVDHRSDIYALGAVAYFLLVGAPPVKGNSVVEVCAWHMYEKPERPSARLGEPVPASLEALILRMLEKDPAKRPQSASEIVEALDAATDIPPWTAEDARGAWEALPASHRNLVGGSEGGAEADDAPPPMSRAFPVDLERR